MSDTVTVENGKWEIRHYLRTVIVNIAAVSERYIPQYQTEEAACADALACLSESVLLEPKTRVKIPLGFRIQLPSGWELQLRGRSGHADKNGIMITNGIGTIDSDYRGLVSVLLYNSSDKPFVIEDGDRIVQVSLQPIYRFEWKSVTKLDPSKRKGGFGSTGTK